MRLRMILSFVVLLSAACSGSAAPDAGVDAGPDAGPPLSDGGALGSACTSLDQCGGNPQCTSESCSFYVICANGVCTNAGGAQTYEVVKVALSGTAASPIPTYLQIYLLAPQLVGASAGMLDCNTLLDDIDGGTLSPGNSAAVNPLFDTYDQSVPQTSGTQLVTFPTEPAASGSGRVLYIEGYLDIGEPDGGAELLARGCQTFDNTSGDAGTVSLTLSSLW